MIAERQTVPVARIGDRVILMLVTTVAVIGGARLVAATQAADEPTPLVIASHLYALMLTVGLLTLAMALGRLVLRRAGVEGETRIEHGVFTVALGLGVLGTIVFLLGLGQVLTTPMLAVVVTALACLTRNDLRAIVVEAPDAVRAALAVRTSVRAHGRGLALLVPLAELFVGALLLHALVPPTSNDVLTYHLQGPRRYLELGAIAPQLDVQQANMPLGVNMLYLLGLAFGSDEMAGVLHLALALLAAVATFVFGRRFFGERVGYLAAATFISTQLMMTFGTVAFVDYGLTLFDFLAVYAFIIWRENGRRGWLAVAGTLVGCALASKYLGVITAGSLGVWLLALATQELRRVGWRSALGLLLVFGLPALAVAGPWYLKNLGWFGNPFWPFLAGNPNDFNMYLGATSRYANSDGIVGWLLLPWRAYADGSVEYPAIRPPLALLAIPALVFVPRHRIVTVLLCLAGVQLFAWAQGAHLLRYALQALPALSIVAAYVLSRLMDSPRSGALVRPLAATLLVAGLAFPTVIAVAALFAENKLPQLVGLESRQEYLDRTVQNHRLVTLLNAGDQQMSRVLMIGDNRGFYLSRPAWADVSLEVFQSVAAAPDPRTARQRLSALGISHVLVNTRDLFWYEPFDPEGRIRRWWGQFEATRAGYLERVAANEDSTLYRVLP